MSSDFSVIALISAYNEADIIEQVVSDLINQGVQVYFMDDGSTDDTVAAVERHRGRGVIGIEQLARAEDEGARHDFDWERILRRKVQLAAELDASWFIHHDADEFRESPWSHLSLRDAIQHVHALGFNAIDFAGLEFWPVHDRFRAGDDVRDTFTRYTELAPYDRVQIRCWKKTAAVDLVSSGGHEVQFSGRRVFPLRFILRHYPIRGQSHGERKVFQERRNRFRNEERARGWHVQYDQVQEGVSFLRDPSTLTAYNPEAVRLSLTLHPRYPEELEEALASARSESAAASCALAASRAEIERMQQEIDVASQHIDHVTAQLVEARSDEMQREIERASAHIDHVTAQLAQAHEELRVRATEVGTLRVDIEQAQHAHTAALDRQTEEIERTRAAVDRLTRELDALHRSLSWRWTAPARAIVRTLKGS